MRTVVDTMYCGNYRFVVELDTGAETGANQRTIWVAARADADAAPSSQFGAAHLPNTLVEPEKSRLGAKPEEEKPACRQPFEREIANPERPCGAPGEKQGRKLPEKVRWRVREQMAANPRRFEAGFARREPWPLDRRSFDRAALGAQGGTFGGEFHLRDFYFEEANDQHICTFCPSSRWTKRSGSRRLREKPVGRSATRSL